jgi:type I restriction enzyme S subunit
LICRFGVLQKNRIKTNLLISFISKPELYGLRIPVFSDSFTKIFNKLIPKSFSLYNTSISIFRNIEQLILNEIGLNTWNQKQDLFYTTNFSEVIKYGRFDSEYYQPRYKKLEKTIKKYKGGWDIIGNLFSQNLNKFDVKNGEIYNYIEIGSVNISDGSIEPLVIPSYDLPANAKIKLDLDDLIISKVRPYRGALAIVESDNLIGSGAFIVLKEKKNYNKETLLSLLKTPPFLDYSLKFNTGTSYPTIDDDDILSYPIPVFDNTIQDKIRNQVKEAYQVRNQSKKLLDISKYGFELAIEKNEKVAKEWIASELNKSEVTNKNV